MTHNELIQTVAKKLNLKPKVVAILWDQTRLILTKELRDHNKIRIKNFGAFLVVRHKSRTVPDPREMKKKLIIFDQDIPKFRPSEQLRAMLKSVIPDHGVSTIEDGGPEITKPTIQPQMANNQTTSSQSEDQKKPPSEDSPKTKQLAKPIDISYVDLSGVTIDKEVLELIPQNIAEKYQMVAFEKNGNRLKVAMIDPGDREAIDLISRQTSLKIEPGITTATDLKHALDQYNSIQSDLEELTQESAVSEPLKVESEENNDAPAIKIVTNILERAVRDKASDIHIEAEENKLIVRYRIDGILQQVLDLPKNLHSSVVSRLKIMSNLKIDESRLPQDGRLRLTIDKNAVDFRLSTLPTVNGEKVVMRILDKSAGILNFDDLGLTGSNRKRVESNIEKAHGMILVSGPTGSGKTTTLYSIIGKLLNPTINIVTLEDPVEYRIPGINQSQVNPAIEYSFASGLRTIVRQDPDVILIGEIRDIETANMAVHSALTGHVVLSTLHTNDAVGAIPRLIDMGIEPFLITSSTNAVIAQRLVRKICPNCKIKVKLPEESLNEIRLEIAKIPENERPSDNNLIFYKGKGCGKCNDSGYRGRMGIFEVLSVSDAIKELILKRASTGVLAGQAETKEGMVTLKQDGIVKVLAGLTTLEEVWRVTKD